MGILSIASYLPKPGKRTALLALLQRHVPTLRSEGLITIHPATLAEAEDGTIIEVFEWCSGEAKVEAHQNEAVQLIWDQFFELCDPVPLARLTETKQPFANFSSIRNLAPRH